MKQSKATTVKITVIRDRQRGYGYNLRHNKQSGFKGIITNIFTWYRYKSDAIARANELMKCWNK